MADSYQKNAGTTYTSTVAWLFMAFAFAPAALAMWRPIGVFSISLSIVCSLCCSAAAVSRLRNTSRLTIPSFSAATTVAK